ncbi:hypothetical protein JHN49_05350 [Streptomyces sp. MBT57]|nr:hypothetical protein [Streptomyces sp. MBT57]
MGFLPEETSSFVGRRAELARLETALTTRRMTTLIGPGGVGKTRLAVAAATAERERAGERPECAVHCGIVAPPLEPERAREAER